MAAVLISLGIMAIGIPVFVIWRQEPPGRLTWQVALRYLLQCCILFLCGLLVMRDPLLDDWAMPILGGTVLSAGALIVVILGELCQN